MLPHAPPDAVDLVASMLKWNPDDRITVEEALRHHPFMTAGGEDGSDGDHARAEAFLRVAAATSVAADAAARKAEEGEGAAPTNTPEVYCWSGGDGDEDSDGGMLEASDDDARYR